MFDSGTFSASFVGEIKNGEVLVRQLTQTLIQSTNFPIGLARFTRLIGRRSSQKFTIPPPTRACLSTGAKSRSASKSKDAEETIAIESNTRTERCAGGAFFSSGEHKWVS